VTAEINPDLDEENLELIISSAAAIIACVRHVNNVPYWKAASARAIASEIVKQWSVEYSRDEAGQEIFSFWPRQDITVALIKSENGHVQIVLEKSQPGQEQDRISFNLHKIKATSDGASGLSISMKSQHDQACLNIHAGEGVPTITFQAISAGEVECASVTL
jgi:hypothetical protein